MELGLGNEAVAGTAVALDGQALRRSSNGDAAGSKLLDGEGSGSKRVGNSAPSMSMSDPSVALVKLPGGEPSRVRLAGAVGVTAEVNTVELTGSVFAIISVTLCGYEPPLGKPSVLPGTLLQHIVDGVQDMEAIPRAGVTAAGEKIAVPLQVDFGG
mmetsp:Transcript_16310/g.45577  ORF Transcript_16310/g.45577 Transcript_16310/m.45577 type:complete len:156 (+) Transcript_16310:384-851(+)|eukprot:scaffold248382_cov35-Tisochrysis_lutea.AAC.3